MVGPGASNAIAASSAGFTLSRATPGLRKAWVAKKAMAIVPYSLAKASFGMLGKVFGVSRALTYRWIKEAAETLPAPHAQFAFSPLREVRFSTSSALRCH